MSVCEEIAMIIREACNVDAFDGAHMGTKQVGCLVTETMNPEGLNPHLALSRHYLYVEVVDRCDGVNGTRRAWDIANSIHSRFRCSINEFEGYPRIIADPPYEVWASGDTASYRIRLTVDRRD